MDTMTVGAARKDDVVQCERSVSKQKCFIRTPAGLLLCTDHLHKACSAHKVPDLEHHTFFDFCGMERFRSVAVSSAEMWQITGPTMVCI
jgi:hypothetical protein